MRITATCPQLVSLSVVIALTSWHLTGCDNNTARIEGIHFHQGKPAPGEIILTYRDSYEDIQYFATADAKGAFVFENVRPAEATIGRRVAIAGSSRDSGGGEAGASHTRRLFPRPGEELHVRIGDGHVTIKGEVTGPDGQPLEAVTNTQWIGRLTTDIEGPAPPAGLSPAEIDAWQTRFDASEESANLRATMQHYIVDVSEGGYVTVEDVLPGNYVLWIKRTDGVQPPGSATSATVSRKLTVPEGESPTTLDLGKLALEPAEVQ